MSNPYNITMLDEMFRTLGQSVMPWGKEYAVLVFVLFGWFYISLKGGFEKSLLSGFFLSLVGLIIQYFWVGIGSGFTILALLSTFQLLIYVMYLRKL